MTSQDFLSIKDIRDDVAILKDGSIIAVLQTSAVNFDLLSENEQLAIISTFAALLNSLSFPIQIVIRSKRLDITSYIDSLSAQAAKQTNPLLKEMMNRYKTFVETIIRENEVLDKQFYIIVSVSGLEVGISGSAEKDFPKAMTILLPRRDHIMRQIARIGLKATQLNNEKLIKLFYDIYNESDVIALEDANSRLSEQQSNQQQNQPATPTPPPPSVISPPQAPSSSLPQAMPAPTPVPPPQKVAEQPVAAVPNVPSPNYQTPRANYTSPFVVEELPEDYGRA